jgi:general secretion pathway protein N
MVWKAVVAVVAALVVAVAFAPAAWLGEVLRGRSALRLVHPSGTVWDGSAMIAISDGRLARLVPGRVSWRVEPGGFLAGRVEVSLRHRALQRPVRIAFDGRTATLQPGEARLPAALLETLGAPFNTIRPGGTLHLRWDTLTLGSNRLEGNLLADWDQACSSLWPVGPLGRFRLTAAASGERGQARVMTLEGPLLLEGEASLDNGTIRFTGTADAQPEMRASLNGLLGVLGRRTGERVLLSWELRR